MKVKIKKLNEKAIIPTYGTPYAAGADLYACVDEDITINPNETVFVGTGISIEVPKGNAAFIYARSGLACKKGIAPANKVGVVDSDYRGEIKVALHNHSSVAYTVAVGERIAQMVVAPYIKCDFEETDTLEETERGAGGFGSTGSK